MSNWKRWEYWYLQDEYLFGINSYWWGSIAMNNNLGPNNKMVFITQCRVEKNRQRKMKRISKVYNH